MKKTWGIKKWKLYYFAAHIAQNVFLLPYLSWFRLKNIIAIKIIKYLPSNTKTGKQAKFIYILAGSEQRSDFPFKGPLIPRWDTSPLIKQFSWSRNYHWQQGIHFRVKIPSTTHENSKKSSSYFQQIRYWAESIHKIKKNIAKIKLKGISACFSLHLYVLA